MAVLLIACSAVVTGATSFAAIGEWAADAPQDVLARLGARTATVFSVRVPPSGATGARGSRHGTSPAAHLLAAMTGTGLAVTQLRVPDKTNEITCFAALLEPFDLHRVTVTGEALCRRRHKASYADAWIMPTRPLSPLVGGTSVPVRLA